MVHLESMIIQLRDVHYQPLKLLYSADHGYRQILSTLNHAKLPDVASMVADTRNFINWQALETGAPKE